tara:strand:+ start:252 stop:677 length:426 start_codon:yes stop_codon:yes gene_type:complete
MKKFILSILLSASFLAHSQDINFGDGEFIVETNIDAVSTQDGENFKISSSGDAGDYGKVYLSYTFTSILNTPDQGEFTGFAWAQQGEAIQQATLQGVWKKKGNVFILYSLDSLTDGNLMMVSGVLDMVNQTLNFKVSPIQL